MAKRVISIRLETPAEKRLREWFETQAVESPKTIEEASRLLIGLITGLLGVLFTVLAVAGDPLPVYIRLPLVRWGGAAAVGLWLVSLLAALVAIWPRKWRSYPGMPDAQSQVFMQILRTKAGWLTAALIAFGLATAAFGVVLIGVLLAV